MNYYDMAYLAASPLAAPVLAWRRLRHGKYRESMPGMFGRQLDGENPARWQQGSVWVHAVSVGEVIATRPVLPLLRERFPGLPLLLTTVTETGQAQAKRLGPDGPDEVRYFPADFSWVVDRFARVYRPRIFVTMETEFWPNAMNRFRGHGARLFVFNGKLSERSCRRYQRFSWAFREPLSGVSAFCMQTADDAARLRGLGIVEPDRIRVTGNCKFDADIPRLTPAGRTELLAQLGLRDGRQVVVFGSTHPGEEEVAMKAMDEVWRASPDAAMILVPRHPERFAEVWGALQRSGIAARRLSTDDGTGDGEPRVVLVDKMGLLVSLYGVSTVSVVAGSLVPGIGGHNLLEAAAQGVPVIHGPYMHSQPEILRAMDAAGASVMVEPENLGTELAALIVDETRRAELGRRGLEAVEANRGAARRCLEVMEEYLSGEDAGRD